MELTTRTELRGTEMVNLPSRSELVPWLLPLTRTEAKGRVSFVEASVTVPETVTSCPYAHTENSMATTVRKDLILSIRSF